MIKSNESLHEFTHFAIRELGIKPSKSLGQNFLISSKIRDRIIDLVNPDNENRIIEIGGGLGALTIPLFESGAAITVYEIDNTLNNWLSGFFSSATDRVSVKGDFLNEYPPDGLSDRNFKVVGNIPYQITSPIFEKIYNHEIHPSTVTLMMQQEVAERMQADVHSKTRGRITIWREYHADVVKSFNVKPGAFYPKPDVGSRVLHLVTKDEFPFSYEEKKLFFEFVKAAFAMKRKTFVNNIIKWNESISRDELTQIMENENINERSRAEDLSLDDLTRLFKNLRNRGL